MERNTKKVSDSMVEQVFQVRPEHLNGAGRLFGGQLMAWIDEVAGLVGIRHSNGDVITASVDNLKFMRGAYLKDLIVLVGRITYVDIPRWMSVWILISRITEESGARSIERI